MDFDLYFYKAISELEKIKAKRSLKERAIFDKDGKKLRLKLEKGYVSGVNTAIDVLKRVRKEFLKDYESAEMEDKERTFIQQIR